jgi:hypothetical protein
MDAWANAPTSAKVIVIFLTDDQYEAAIRFITPSAAGAGREGKGRGHTSVLIVRASGIVVCKLGVILEAVGIEGFGIWIQ